MPMHSLVQLSKDAEDLSDAFLSCAMRERWSRGARRLFKLVTGQAARTKFVARDSSVNTTQHLYDTIWTRLVRVQPIKQTRQSNFEGQAKRQRCSEAAQT